LIREVNEILATATKRQQYIEIRHAALAGFFIYEILVIKTINFSPCLFKIHKYNHPSLFFINLNHLLQKRYLESCIYMSKSAIQEQENQSLNDQFTTDENFAELLAEYEKDGQILKEGTVVKGVVVEISDKGVAIDIGAKSIGYVPLVEFRADGNIEEGDVVDVMLERLENKRGDLLISRDNARRYNNWNYLKNCLEDKTVIEGKVLGKVKGGYAADVDGIIAFLPRSQVDTMLLSDDTFLINKIEKLLVLKIDDIRGNVVVSRRAILEGQRDKERAEVLSTIKIGDALDGVVKNITDYGAFIDFGSFDGLLHLTDISWCRVRHPSEVLSVGQEVKVQVIKYDADTKRVSLGMKQLQENPWQSIETRYPVGSIVDGKVTNIATYGAFVEIENGIEGLVHVSEMSWFKNNLTPNKVLSASQEVKVMILDIDAKNHRISLGMKQCEQNPWQAFSESHKVGDTVEGIVKNYTEFGLFVGFDSGVDGLVHISDVSWKESGEDLIKKYKKDDKINVMVLGSNYEKERISLGIKQLENNNFKAEIEKIKVGDVTSCNVVNVKKDFLEVETSLGLKAIIKRLDVSKNKQDQKTEKFEVGDVIEAKVNLFNDVTGKMLLSIKDMEADEQSAYIYSSVESSSGASLGSILGDALQESKLANAESKEKKEAKKAKEPKAIKSSKKNEAEEEKAEDKNK
jgi:small subunit ribosomal protein S1